MEKLVEGTRVDCLYDGDYYRGTVGEVVAETDKEDWACTVNFDDGDVRDHVPLEDILLPLEVDRRVDCWFEGEQAYFPGKISVDNVDGTYRVDFDDGDVLEHAPRKDIKVLLPAKEADAATDQDGSRGGGCDDEDQCKAQTSSNDHSQFVASEDKLRNEGQEETQNIHESINQETRTPHPEDQDELEDGVKVASNSPNPKPNNSGSSANSANSARDGHWSSSSTSAHEPNSSQGNRGGMPRVESGDGGDRGGTLSPEVSNPLHDHIEVLARSPQLMGEAPPDYRLRALEYQIAAMEQQQRMQEERGETWDVATLSLRQVAFGAGAGSLGSGGSGRNKQGEDPAQVRARVRARVSALAPRVSLVEVVDALSKLRIRKQVALVRLCYGETSAEMVEALCALAEGYSQQGLWSQALNHVSRSSQILSMLEKKAARSQSRSVTGAGAGAENPLYAAPVMGALGDDYARSSLCVGPDAKVLLFPTDDRYFDSYICHSLGSAGCARALLALIHLTRAAAASNGGMVSRAQLEKELLDHHNPVLRRSGHSILGPDMPEQVPWGRAVGHIRQTSDTYTDLNLKVMEGVRSVSAGHARLAFRSASRGGNDCADPEANMKQAVDREEFIILHSLVPVIWEEVRGLFCAGGLGERLLAYRCQTHTNHLSSAHENLLASLEEFDRIGMGESLAASPVLAALGDTLALRHQRTMEQDRRKARKMAEHWLKSEEGHEIWIRESKRLLEECRLRGEILEQVEVERRTWQALLEHRSKVSSLAFGKQKRDLEEATECLKSAWEIQERRLGKSHAAVGAACVSLGNLAVIRHCNEEAVHWFKRALGTFERLAEAADLFERSANYYLQRVEEA
ncbi:unnamed protein product, partial [Discosporangium mesarthrocarpum]